MMKIIFMGSAEFACPALERLLKSGRDEIAGVISQPERPSGRRQKMKKSPVHEFASAKSLPVLTPENINAPENVEALRALKPDLVIVVAYGQILKANILALAPNGWINLHASLLPKYRGAAPIQWAIARGEQKTGVTTMLINEKMDAGDIIAQEEEPISADDTGITLGARLADKGARLLLQTVEMIRRGATPRTKQNEALATYAPRLKKTDGLIDWIKPAKELSNRIRGFQPWPGCFFTLQVKLLAASLPAGGGATGDQGRGASVVEPSGTPPTRRREALWRSGEPTRLCPLGSAEVALPFIPVASLPARGGAVGDQGHGAFPGRPESSRAGWRRRDKTTVRVLRARVEAGGNIPAGTILEARGEGPLIQTGDGSLRLLEVQPEGRKPMSGNAFLCGNKISQGDSLLVMAS